MYPTGHTLTYNSLYIYCPQLYNEGFAVWPTARIMFRSKKYKHYQTLEQVQQEADEVKNIIYLNMDAILERDESIQDLEFIAGRAVFDHYCLGFCLATN